MNVQIQFFPFRDFQVKFGFIPLKFLFFILDYSSCGEMGSEDILIPEGDFKSSKG